MKNFKAKPVGLMLAALLVSTSAGIAANEALAMGHEGSGKMKQKMKGMGGKQPPPISLMGIHMIPEGGLMFGYRYKRMHMEGLRAGTNKMSADTAVTTVPNIFAPPPTVRVVPRKMDAHMHIFNIMYGLNSRVNVSMVLPVIQKDMNMTVYQGPAGTVQLGRNTPDTAGIGDIKFGSMIRLFDAGNHHAHLNFGFTVPTGSLTETATLLTPMNTFVTKRLAYGMQLGSGSFSLTPGFTYTGHEGKLAWGAIYRGFVPLHENSKGYRLGSKHTVSGWLSYKWAPSFNTSVRLAATTQERIRGADPLIAGASTGANPANYGGETVQVFAGANYMFRNGALKGTRIGIEAGLPVYQKVNGVKLENDWVLALGITKKFGGMRKHH